MAFLPIGTRIRYVGTYRRGLFAPPAEEVAAAIRFPLEDNWSLVVEEAKSDSSFFARTETVNLLVRLDAAYGKADDVRLIVNTEVSNQIGAAVTSSRITGVKQPGKKEESTGAPPPPPDDGNGDGLKFPFKFDFDFGTVIVAGMVVVAGLLILAVVLAPSTPARVTRSFSRRR